ncbi:hypothetical protein M3J09_007169 [Ascochyta lentis]
MPYRGLFSIPYDVQSPLSASAQPTSISQSSIPQPRRLLSHPPPLPTWVPLYSQTIPQSFATILRSLFWLQLILLYGGAFQKSFPPPLSTHGAVRGNRPGFP